MSKITLSYKLFISLFLATQILKNVNSINQKCQYISTKSQFNVTDSTCPLNSVCSSNGYCVCNQNYFGNCQNQGHILSTEKQSFNITGQMNYFIVKPTIDIFVYYQFTLCNPQTINNQQVLNLWYDDGTLDAPTTFNSLGVDKYLKITQQCIALMTPFFKFQKQANGDAQILILGIKLKNNANYTISISVVEQEIFGFQILIKIIIILICAIFISSIGGIIYCIYKCRRRNLSQNLNEQKNDLTFFNELMPQAKVVKGQYQDQLCSVCLADLLQDQKIRKTVCDHVFHKTCLDEWCQTNLSCPICRYPLDQQNLIYKIAEKQASNKSNINNTTIEQENPMSEQLQMSIKTNFLTNQHE